MRKNSIKNTRINGEVQRELSEIIRTEIKDPRVAGAMISVVSVDVTADLKYCKIYVSVLGDEETVAEAVDGLKSAMGYIRRELAHRVNLRNTPELKFILDQSIEHGIHMSRLIDEVTRDMRGDGEEGLPEDPDEEPSGAGEDPDEEPAGLREDPGGEETEDGNDENGGIL